MKKFFLSQAVVNMAASLRRTLVRQECCSSGKVPRHSTTNVILNLFQNFLLCLSDRTQEMLNQVQHDDDNMNLFAFTQRLSKAFLLLSTLLFSYILQAQTSELDKCNITWNSQSKNSGESMPCGGGDIGLNVWTENGDVLFYLSKSGTFDENNAFLKLGRVRLKLSPNPFEGGQFRQELVLKDGNVKITGSKGNLQAVIIIWVDVFNPVIHVEVSSSNPVKAEATYESWRYKDRLSKGRENNANSYKWANIEVKTFKDDISFSNNQVSFYHHNKPVPSVFDYTVKLQGLDSVKDQMFNPIKNLTFGGVMEGTNMVPAGKTSGTYLNTDFEGWKLQSKATARSHKINIYLHTQQSEALEQWQTGLQQTVQEARKKEKVALTQTKDWWKQFWERSFIFINPDKPNEDAPEWQVGRNYQLFRYMLGCNAFGQYPTKFNGGLFTYDPALINPDYSFTPDFRNWGGGLMTAQNQRLVYFPMLKNGDFELMKPQFDFYMHSLRNAELRSEVYWGHKGACFTEQLENFGLPNSAEYGLNRPEWFDKGVEYNAWLEYEWDTVLEFCLMMLEQERYANKDISTYIPFVESCLTFFNEHYQYLAKHRGIKSLDGNGHLVLFPGAAGETYKMAYNASSTVAGLKTILTRLLQLPSQYLNEQKRKDWQAMLSRVPPISFGEFNGHKTIAPAKVWERVNNTESMQLYPVFPWGIYGIGKPDLDVAINTWKYDTSAVKFRSHIGWKQDNIFAARMGLTNEAVQLTTLKLKNSGRRFPAFWGPGFDWTPDHNWGGSGMIGLQEMLFQTDDRKIYLFPAWPKDWNVHFKLHAPYETTIEAVLKNGKVEMLKVIPEKRRKDIVNMF